jgi:hypothetical protein
VTWLRAAAAAGSAQRVLRAVSALRSNPHASLGRYLHRRVHELTNEYSSITIFEPEH